MDMKLAIYGAGGLGREVREIAHSQGQWEEIIYIDDYNSDIIDGCKRMSFEVFCRDYDRDMVQVICAVGDPKQKKLLYDRLSDRDYRFCNIIHERSEISSTAIIGEGVIIKSGVVISVDAKIGNNVTVMDNTYIAHGNVIGDHSHISSNVALGGDVAIGSGSFVGASVCVKERIKIGESSLIGIGTTVVKDIPDRVVCYNKKEMVYMENNLEHIFN